MGRRSSLEKLFADSAAAGSARADVLGPAVPPIALPIPSTLRNLIDAVVPWVPA